jgi:hypothetical protein
MDELARLLSVKRHLLELLLFKLIERRHLLAGGLHDTPGPADGSGGPVDAPDGVEDGTPDPLGGVVVEVHALGGIEAVGGLDETQHARPDELLPIDVPGTGPTPGTSRASRAAGLLR